MTPTQVYQDVLNEEARNGWRVTAFQYVGGPLGTAFFVLQKP